MAKKVKKIKRIDIKEFIDDDGNFINKKQTSFELKPMENGSTELPSTVEKKRATPDIFRSGLYGPRGGFATNLQVENAIAIIEDTLAVKFDSKDEETVEELKEKNPLLYNALMNFIEELDKSQKDTIDSFAAVKGAVEKISTIEMPGEKKNKLKKLLSNQLNTILDNYGE